MTGFGAASRTWEPAPASRATLEVEARFVNARHLELKIRQPFGARVDHEIRGHVEARLGRGRVDVTVVVRALHASAATDGIAAWGVEPARLDALLSALAQTTAIARERGLELSPPNVLDVLRFASTPTRTTGAEPEPEPPAFLGELVAQALDALAGFRRGEGLALAEVLLGLHDELAASVAAIAAWVRDEGGTQRERLAARLHELCAAAAVAPPDDHRVAQELAILAGKADVSEELARLDMHLARMREVIAAPAATGQGRTLEFVAQELLREVTTIGSKVASHAAAARVIDAKATIERIREQVCNVE